MVIEQQLHRAGDSCPASDKATNHEYNPNRIYNLKLNPEEAKDTTICAAPTTVL